NNQTAGIDAGLGIQETPYFTDNGRYIMFSLQSQPDNRQPDADAVLVDVWSYMDTLLQTTQAESQEPEPRPYRATIQSDGAKVIRLENEYEYLKTFFLPGDFAVVGKISELMNGDRYWIKRNYYESNWLVSLKDGSRQLLPTRNFSLQSPNMLFSPGGNYLIYFDAERGYNYFSYDLRTGKLMNISSGVSARLLGNEQYYHRPKGQKNFMGATNYGIAAWLKGDKGLLVYDDFDIWQLDLSGKKAPVNITNGYGHRQQVLLSLALNDRMNFGNSFVVLSLTDTLLLKAFNRQNKNNGFYRKILGQPGDPELLSMSPYFFQTQGLTKISGFDKGMKPLKATGANTWIMKRQSATDAPNYFVTNDFTIFTRLTDIQPQKKYNWLTVELHRFRQMDGTMSQGVLYKPENFNPGQKYPVIISFYFQHSDQLHLYPSPELLYGPLDYCNPAWFVSHGYLVFCPDIYFRDKAWGPSTLNTMDGAARYLSGFSYVDGRRIGLSGHSNSGRMGYYVLTHSHFFAAMSIGTGALGPDLLSSALSFEDYLSTGRSTLRQAEEGSDGLGNLWKNKALWLDHTAVLQADKVTSPLLLFFNDKDGDPVRRGAELFIALWRLEKKVWWLNYNQEGHVLQMPNALKDYTIRYTQFFDHYLKGTPAPRWMTQGIPFKYKQIESRYDLDPAGSCSLPGKKECPVCKAWNKQHKRTPEMFTKSIREWKLDKDLQDEIDKEKTQRYKENMKGEAERIKENNAKLSGK
ncbi:MAG: prolyl oligopeptidase family serine peptidase, partial [Sphingobacteriales bacterium]